MTIEKWGMFETAVSGRADGNPIWDYRIQGTFTSEDGQEQKTVEGFYDGDGIYRVRFMPSREGRYTYQITGNFREEGAAASEERAASAEKGAAASEELSGSFLVTAPTGENHGPVEVVDERYLGYGDGTPYYSIGTTCYAWVHQTMEMQEQTLRTLKESPFNKIRFCFFPKFYVYNKKEPLTAPFAAGAGEGQDPVLQELQKNQKLFPGQPVPDYDYGFDYTKPNVEHYRRMDLRIRQLMELGIEADIILMHPYDRWGMNSMSAQCCDNYLRYVVARYSAYRNVWWSLANEYDLIHTKTEADWERYGALIREKDPYGHLRSIHNCGPFYDHSRDWITHCSMQRQDFYKTTELTDEYLKQYGKPVVWDEICYEGNIQLGWGNITAQELVRRFWEGALRGGHCGHGETYLSPDEILWWSHGNVLKGDSVPRLRFLLDILKETPGRYIKKTGGTFDEVVGIPSTEDKEDIPFHLEVCGYELHYLGITQPAYRELFLPEGVPYQVDIIDTWNMTVTDGGIHSGFSRVELPGRQYMALRIIKC